MTLIEVRDATKKDLKAVTSLWTELAEYHSKLSDDFALAWDSRLRWSRYLASKFKEISTKLVVAEEDGKLVGFMLCLLSPNTPVYAERKIGVVSDVYVLPERRKRGVTRLMFDHAVKWFRKNKVRSIQLGVAAANPEAIAVWRKMGFEPFIMYERLDIGRVPEKRPRTTSRKLIRKKKVDKRSGLRSRIRIRRGAS
jgi:L-amino acid N-acyltransferase YncA